ncbi:MAG: FKBP-type peptidyl-prolyl cis-trans isomerase FkpA [Chlamydiales bacterium]|nr:FKBP-type peptidyl-prolyl cis-trans isomerase FkpA [Chlamydiales bacterium]MCH9619750.1 FKBP-type peptidyl-prolyl cis-trans isomerase FkpA [Chlamydiales bacterium]MCH9623356.1 FKBP-type peptidyl-prolyl cis-trans isomerase FkpA [Chlamydiales bacterium]
MKKRWIFTLLTTCMLSLHAEEVETFNHDQIAESLGHLIVRHLANPGFKLDLDRVIKGIEDERNGRPSPLSEEEYEQAVYAIQESLFNETAEENLASATTFLEKNAKEKDITIVEPKLHYRVDQAGEGECVAEESMPLIHYKGTLIDGTTFASSIESGDPITLPLQQTIPGFTKGLVGMKEGEKRTLYIHPDLAYGLSGHLPPNSLLIFEVEILKANAAPEEIALEGSTDEEVSR